MPYLHLDLAKTYPSGTKRELASRLCHLYADVMQTQLWRPNVGIAELGEDNLFHLGEDGLEFIDDGPGGDSSAAGPSISALSSAGASSTSAARCLTFQKRQCSSNSLSIPARRSCATGNGPATGVYAEASAGRPNAGAVAGQ